MSPDANFEVVKVERGLIVIRDLGPHDQYKTVTNAAESVVDRLAVAMLLPPGRRLFYYDSEGEFAEILLDDKQYFAGFAPARERL